MKMHILMAIITDCSSLRVTNIKDLFLSSELGDEVDDRRKIFLGHLIVARQAQLKKKQKEII